MKEFLDMDDKDDAQMKKIKQDSTKFVLERLKKEDYSPRQEQSGPNGEPVKVEIVEEK